MRQSLAVLLTCFAMTTAFAQGQETDCTRLLSDTQLFCESADRQCDHVESCLQRKGTCLGDSKPTNAQECQALHRCSKQIEAQLPASERCEYYWIEKPDPKDSVCHNRGFMLFQEEGCPGRFSGLLRTFVNGFDASLDTEFNCDGTYHMYASKKKTCLDTIAKFKATCAKSPGDLRTISDFQPKDCTVYDNFKKLQKNGIPLLIDGDRSVHQGARAADPWNQPSIEIYQIENSGTTR
jgi:hypothetical protein